MHGKGVLPYCCEKNPDITMGKPLLDRIELNVVDLKYKYAVINFCEILCSLKLLYISEYDKKVDLKKSAKYNYTSMLK